MAYGLTITEKTLGINVNVKYEKLDKAERPEITAKTPTGTIAKERTVFNGQVLMPGATQKQWVDVDGNVYAKSELTFWLEEQQVAENTQTKIMEIVGFNPIKNYTDTFVIEKYYELFPSDNGHKKDFDRDHARAVNLYQMRKLWEYLHKNQVVARGELCVSSRGFLASDGYIRAIEIYNADDKKTRWGLEIGLFKEAKVFEHLNDTIPTTEPAAAPVLATSGRTRLKLV